MCVLLGVSVSVCILFICFDVVVIAVVISLAGSGNQGFSDGVGTQASFSLPYGVAVDASGTVFLAEYYNNRVRKISGTGGTWADYCFSAVKQNLRLSIILSP